MSEQVTRGPGRWMMILAWIAGIVLATQLFALWEKRQHNPNREPVSRHEANRVEVELVRNASGHFVLDGRINGRPATLLVDTGATDVAVPQELAERLGLPAGSPVLLSTANGTVTGYRSRLDSLRMGDIELRDVRAVIAPGMDTDEVLLGMSALRQLEFTQRGGSLVLRQYKDH